MKNAIRLLIVFVCAAAMLSGNLEARRISRDNAVYITALEIKDLERKGLLIPAGRDAWKTRSGLLIAGRDPEGRTRLEHIMRHGADSPGRPRHGVFSLTKAGIIELLDEAWNRIRAGGITSKEGGAKAAYTVKMGRSIGYLGGRMGRERGNPRLESVRLVVKKDKGAVITFFPM
ncbi:MAG: hypothetical protein KA369_03730 [Spirochaetes bacterium]|nr:hypothetical protein [Spirochaetota bacterium]